MKEVRGLRPTRFKSLQSFAVRDDESMNYDADGELCQFVDNVPDKGSCSFQSSGSAG